MSLVASFFFWIFIAALLLAGLVILLLSLFHVRYDVAWFGMWTGGASLPHEKSGRLEFGFPGFMWKWSGGESVKTRDEHDVDSRATARGQDANEDSEVSASSNRVRSSTETQAMSASGDVSDSEKATPSAVFGGGVGQPGVAESRSDSTPAFSAQPQPVEGAADSTPLIGSAQAAPHKSAPKDPNRFRKALFRFVTDGPVWAILFRYAIGMLVRAARLLHARMEFSAGHPDPAFLGRMAGRWYAVSAALPKDRVVMNFRFQDQSPTFGARVVGGFSLLAFLWFLAAALFTFPLFRLGWRAWQGWKLRHLGGWRAWTYRKIQSV